MSDTDSPSEELLNAYLDGELSPAEAAEVARRIAASGETASQLAAWRRIDQGLAVLYGSSAARPAPVQGASRRLPSWLLAIAATVLLAIGGAGGWWARTAMPDAGHPDAAAFITYATNAHRIFVREVRHPVEVPAAEEEHLFRWLSNRLDCNVFAPPLDQYGFFLVGGRLLSDSSGPAAQFMYEDATGTRLTLYVSRSSDNGDTAFRFTEANGVRSFYWVEAGFGYALIGPLDRSDMLAVAERIYDAYQASAAG